MPFRLQHIGASILHITDADLRLEPGQAVTVPVVTPQMAQLAARGYLTITDLASPASQGVGTAPEATPTPVPSASSMVSSSAPPPRRHRNAAAVLPPRLLARVQRVVTGYMVIPPRVTATETRRQQVAALQQRGVCPSTMAATLGISRRQVHRLLRDLAMADPPPMPVSSLPAPLLAQVQQYVTGRLYVPAVTAATRRRARLHRAFAAGEATTVIARRERCSARQVRRERVRWRACQDSAGETPAHNGRSTDDHDRHSTEGGTWYGEPNTDP